MNISRSHFELIAAVIRETSETYGTRNTAAQDVCESIAGDFAARFKAINPRFKKDQFMTACGLEN